MAELAAVRSAKSRSDEDTIQVWSWTRVSRVCRELLQLKVPNNQIIEVPPPQPVTGETESLNGTPAAAVATATTASDPHPRNNPLPPQLEQPIARGPTNPQRSPTDRHEVSQSSFDQISQQGRAEDDGAMQNGAGAHPLQDTNPSKKAKGKAKAIAHVTNHTRLSSISVPVSSNLATAQCDVDVPAIHTYSVEIAFSKTSTERLSKIESIYMDKSAMIPEAISDRWKNEIQGRLDKDLQDLIRANFGGKDNILSTTQLYMVGTKHKETLAVKPTIVITCGTVESKRRIAVELGNLKLHYLDDFGYPWRVRYKRKPPSWTASPPDETPHIPVGTSGRDISNLQGVYVEQNVKPGVSGLKLRFDVLQDGITEQRYATLGGIISIDEAKLLMTTAHPFLAELDSGNEHLVSDDLEAPISDSDSDYQSDAEVAEPPNFPRTFLSFDQMRYSRLWISEQWTRVAYSFLGKISLSSSGNAVKLQWPSSSDWALFQVTESSLLSKLQTSPQFSSFIPEDQLTPGEVQIMDTVDTLGAGFLTQTTASIHTAKAVIHVREILLHGVLSKGASGAWVIRGSGVCGYVVAATGSGKSCFMVPMDYAFKEIEAAFGEKPKLGAEMVNLSEEDEVIGAPFNTGLELTSDDHRLAGSTRSSYESRRSDISRPVPATDTSKIPWIHALTRKSMSIFHKERRPYKPLSVFDREAGLQSAPRIQADSRDPHAIEIMNIEEVSDTANRISRIGRENERSTPTISESRQEDPVDDRKKATHWPTRKKAGNFYAILTLTFLNTLASTVAAPGVPSIMQEFDTNNVLGTFVISIFVLGQITGPLLLAPLSDSHGRLLVYHLSNLSFIIWNVACALAPNTATLLIFRLLAGCAAAGPLAIGRSSVEDMFLEEKKDEGPMFLVPTANGFLKYRERPLILLSIASMLGPCIGPVFGGYLVEKEGWRWTFWLLAIAGGLNTITAMVVMSETNEWAISEGRMRRFHHLLRSRQTLHWLMRPSIRFSINKPFKSLDLSWTVLAPIIYLALMKGYMSILYTTLTPVFTAMYKYTTRWHLTPGPAGLTFFTTVVGTVAGSFLGYILFEWGRDELHKRMRRRGLSLRQYLPLAFVPSSLFASFGLISFGWTILNTKAQIIVPLVATTLAITGTTLAVLTAETFIYRTSKGPIPDAMHGSNFLGSWAGGLFPLIAQRLYLLPSGIGWTNTIFGVGAFFILERVWYWYRNGRKVSNDLLPRRSLRFEETTNWGMEDLGVSRNWRSQIELIEMSS